MPCDLSSKFDFKYLDPVSIPLLCLRKDPAIEFPVRAIRDRHNKLPNKCAQ